MNIPTLKMFVNGAANALKQHSSNARKEKAQSNKAEGVPQPLSQTVIAKSCAFVQN